MSAYLVEAVGLLLRWLHVVAAIAWIGESFYFVALDRGLTPPKVGGGGVSGESWSVHGGGFYHKQKYLVAPAVMPEELHWSKWKSYTTWISGFCLFAMLYLASPGLYLIDPAVAAWTPAQAVMLAIAFLPGSWLVYDLLCRLVGFRDALLGALVGVYVVALTYAATQCFSGRAAFLIVGASMATIMSANVFFVIIPGQKRMVAALARGEAPDPLPGRRGKQRSVHNTYFTLPVVFAMLSIHYATAYAHPQSWLVLVLFMAAGAVIRQFFVVWHSRERAWWLLAVAAAVLLAVFGMMAPREPAAAKAPAVPVPATPAVPAPAATPAVATPEAVQAILGKHCIQCHSAKPSMIASAPKGLQFDQPDDLRKHAELIRRQVVALKVMPPGNFTGMTDQERSVVEAWLASRP
ncbi:urate hydroxylase PuuD [Tahibacter amnicola]|uniref:Urate hydroxylase PuuD n=1 Tax=Tahibacter amnicola TaxID=2976241 RepID=A0ABY6BHW7_9GAMM|nr:urate hydroxylase PuuD [Tahibacter amnicola]UXI68675.1 urate hydroxylase PuuD [Tahibacter amnicola]